MAWEQGKTLAQAEEEAILAAIEHFAGDRKRAAADLGICERTLTTKIARMRAKGLNPACAIRRPKGAVDAAQ